MMESYYLIKAVSHGGRAPYTGFDWPLPTEEGPGEWVPPIPFGELKPCRCGYHGCTVRQAWRWFDSDDWEAMSWEGGYQYDFYLMECRGRYRVHEQSKTAVGQARLVKKIELTDEQREELADHCCCNSDPAWHDMDFARFVAILKKALGEDFEKLKY